MDFYVRTVGFNLKLLAQYHVCTNQVQMYVFF